MRDHSTCRIAILSLLIAVCACGRPTIQPVPLPPLDVQPEAATASPPPTYRLHPGDLLRIKFLYHPELDVKVPIRPDGGITLQMAGDIHAAGITTDDLEKVIKERTSDRLREPEVSVLVARLGDQRVYVGGEVRVPGFVAFHEGMTPLQAVMDRGGFTEVARIDSVLRVSPSQSEYQGTRLDFTRTLSTGTPEQSRLVAGDVLFVPRTFIGDVNSFVRMYIRGLLPVEPKIGAGTSF
jgi:protein involved in polysaccharide export with SLBB domain